MLISTPGCLFELLEVTYPVLDEDESNYISVASNQLRRNEQAHLTVPN